VEFFGGRKLPVARDEGLLVEHVADETVVYDSKTKAAHCLSPVASIVFARCDGRTTVEELAAVATERLGEPVDPPLVVDALAQLEERELLAVSPRLTPSGDGLSRRQMIHRSAAAAAGVAAVPLITSITAPAAVAQTTATCANILCCPCCTNSDLNKEECCTTPVTVNCQCVQASQNVRPGPPGFGPIEGGKFCKTTGAGAPTDEECLGTSTPVFPEAKPPATWATLCTPFVEAGGDCGPCGESPINT
jgi:hypothetical protein